MVGLEMVFQITLSLASLLSSPTHSSLNPNTSEGGKMQEPPSLNTDV